MNTMSNTPKRIAIIGAVAAGTSAAAKARRNDESAIITLYEKDTQISYSGCGLPYYIGGSVTEFAKLTPRDPAFFKSKYNVEVRTQHEVLEIDAVAKTLTVKNLVEDTLYTDGYDVLILATGASAIQPSIPGATLPHVFTLRNPASAQAIHAYMTEKTPATAVIIGSGFIGLEMAESLTEKGLAVSIVEKLDAICPALDADMALHLSAHLSKKGLRVLTGSTAIGIDAAAVQLDSGETIPADLVIMAVGVRPNVSLAKSIGVRLGTTGAIQVNNQMQTNLPDVYACGDCIETYSVVDGQPFYRPLGSTANKTGRIAGDVCTGGDLQFRGICGTGIFRVLGLAVATTGLKEPEARAKGFDVITSHNIKPDKPDYLGGAEMIIKTIADRRDGKLLGVQIIGFDGVDKRIDVFVMALTCGMKAEDLFHLDLAYAPPFSTTKDPVMYSGMILENAIHRGRELMQAEALLEEERVSQAEMLLEESLLEEERTAQTIALETSQETAQATDDLAIILAGKSGAYQIIDARVAKQYEAGHVTGAVNIPHGRVRTTLDTLDKTKPTIVYCNKGTTGNAVQNILLGLGFSKVYNLSGGYKQYKTMRGATKGNK